MPESNPADRAGASPPGTGGRSAGPARDAEDAVRPVYRERAALIAHLAACHPSVIVRDGDPQAPGWAVIFVSTSVGQLSWHLADADLDLFGHVTQAGPGSPEAPGWDGHTTPEKYARLAALTRNLASGKQHCACTEPGQARKEEARRLEKQGDRRPGGQDQAIAARGTGHRAAAIRSSSDITGREPLP